jgi:hypothetical protein
MTGVTIDVHAPGTALTYAIKALAERQPKLMHLEVWRSLHAEVERRAAGTPECAITLSRRAWDKLPDSVRGYLSITR